MGVRGWSRKSQDRDQSVQGSSYAEEAEGSGLTCEDGAPTFSWGEWGGNDCMASNGRMTDESLVARDLGSKRSWPIRDTIPEFAWSDAEKP